MLEMLFAPILAELEQIRRLLAMLVLPVPGPLKPALVAEEENDMLVYKVAFPPKPATPVDITTQRFTVSVEGESVLEADYPIDVTESEEFKVNDDDEVTLSLVYVDDAGNTSGATSQTFVAKDTIPPDAPGPFGEATLVREE